MDTVDFLELPSRSTDGHSLCRTDLAMLRKLARWRLEYGPANLTMADRFSMERLSRNGLAHIIATNDKTVYVLTELGRDTVRANVSCHDGQPRYFDKEGA